MYGKKLKKLIKDKGFEQKDIAEMLGVDEQTVSRWVNKAHLSTEVIEQVCNALNVPLIEFIFDTNEIAKYLNMSPDVLEMSRKIDKLDDDIKIDFLAHVMTGLKLVLR